MSLKGLTFAFEQAYFDQGMATIAGVDEVGRGSLAGPVVAACVVVNHETPLLPGVNDSKQLSTRQRQAVVDRIKESAAAWSVGVSDNDVIDRVGIVPATYAAMVQAVNLVPLPNLIVIDGPAAPPQLKLIRVQIRPVVRGDQQVYAVAAASIIAKVYRDELMRRWHERYPCYAWDHNKGYGTRSHQAAIQQHGPSPLHRTTFISGCWFN